METCYPSRFRHIRGSVNTCSLLQQPEELLFSETPWLSPKSEGPGPDSPTSESAALCMIDSRD